jgi:hypothetical protein
MGKSRTEKIASYEEQIAKLQDQRKQELLKHQQEERKAKESRYKKRHKLLEDALPETIGLTDEQYNIFLERAVANDTVRKIIANILSQGAKPAVEKQDNATANDEESTT